MKLLKSSHPPYWFCFGGLTLSMALLSVATISCTGHEAEEGRLKFSSSRAADDEARAAAEEHTGIDHSFKVEDPPFSEGIFPCMECHVDIDPDPTPRALDDDHPDIQLKHGDRSRWCFDCHDPDDRNMLRLASGKKIPFRESYRLCGQCHGAKFRDWRKGLHGRRKGEWRSDGVKTSYVCAECHNPHSPKFKRRAPEPPPKRPEGTNWRSP